MYESEGGKLMNAALFEATFHNLIGAVDEGYGSVAFDRPDFEFVQKLRESAKYFAARKTILQVIQLTALTIDEEKGTARSFSEFRKLSKGIVGNYNRDWLETEYATALQSARSAREWQDFEADADLYPNLEYLRTISAHPREQHLRYVGTIRPINDSFWDTHYPPIGWNCSCSVKNTDAIPTEIPNDIDETDPVAPALQNNPAKTAQLFNVMASSYGEKTKETPDTKIEEELRVHVLPKMNFFIPAYKGKNGGSLEIHPGIDKSEFNVNTKIGFTLAKKGYDVKLLPPKFTLKVKDPDLLIDEEVADFKRPTTISAFNSAIKRGGKQKCHTVICTVNSDELPKTDLKEAIGAALSNIEKHSSIKRLIIHYEQDDTLIEFNRKQMVTRDDIEARLK